MVLEDIISREVCPSETGAWKVIAEFLHAAHLFFVAPPEEEIVVPSLLFFSGQFLLFIQT